MQRSYSFNRFKEIKEIGNFCGISLFKAHGWQCHKQVLETHCNRPHHFQRSHQGDDLRVME